MASTIRHRVRSSDTLRSLSATYLGDHRRWVEIAAINAIAYDDYRNLSERFDYIALPIPVGPAPQINDLFLTDIAVKDRGLFITDAGDLGLVSGVANVAMAIARALSTERGSIVWHPDYGLAIQEYVGHAGGDLFLELIRLDAERVIRRDPRVSGIENLVVTQTGETRVLTISGVVRLIGTEDTINLEEARSY